LRPWRTGADVLRDRLGGQRAVPSPERAAGEAVGERASEPPTYVAERLAELRLLHDVPFQYVVPAAALLPAESIRFFHLDDGWTDALAEGALSIGDGDSDRLAVDRVRPARDRAVGGVRERHRGRHGTAREDEPGPITGLVLRSSAVARWPGMAVRAYAGEVPPDVEPDEAPDGVRLPLLRLERVAPTVLIALFGGVPTLVVLEEPHGNAVLGVAAAEDGGWTLALRAADGRLIEDDDEAVRIDVPLRPGAEELGVVDVAALRDRLEQEAGSRDEMPQTMSPAALAIELMRPPWRQRFGAPGNL